MSLQIETPFGIRACLYCGTFRGITVYPRNGCSIRITCAGEKCVWSTTGATLQEAINNWNAAWDKRDVGLVTHLFEYLEHKPHCAVFLQQHSKYHFGHSMGFTVGCTCGLTKTINELESKLTWKSPLPAGD